MAATYPFCGYILERWGWPYVFYSTGLVGMLWFLAWWLFVYDTPAQHPYITQLELTHITNSLTNVVSSVKVRARNAQDRNYIEQFAICGGSKAMKTTFLSQGWIK